jgi:hypothetical protein
MGQRTFETRSLYLILAEKRFTLPAANEMLPLSALFARKSREIGQCPEILNRRQCRDAGTLRRLAGLTLSPLTQAQ